MFKQILLEAGVVMIVAGGVTLFVAQEKPSPPGKAEGRPAARQAEEDTPKEKVARRRAAQLLAILKKLESPEQKARVKERAPGQPDTPLTITRTSKT
jgi:hypothetical protein